MSILIVIAVGVPRLIFAIQSDYVNELYCLALANM